MWKSEGTQNNETTFGFSILNSTQTYKATLSKKSNLDKRMYRVLLHGKTEISISKENGDFIVPTFFFSQQGGSNEIIFGALYKTEIGLNSNFTGYYTSSYLYGGIYYRLQDALIAIFKFEWKKQFQLGLSYDINASKLRTASKYQGGLEISLTWKGDF